MTHKGETILVLDASVERLSVDTALAALEVGPGEVDARLIESFRQVGVLLGAGRCLWLSMPPGEEYGVCNDSRWECGQAVPPESLR